MANAGDSKNSGEVNKADRSIDRLKTCPLLLRVFWNKNRHHLPREYEQGHIPENELQIYTWLDASLGELTQLIKEVIPDVRRRGVQFAFAAISPEENYSRYRVSEIGKTENGQRRSDEQIQLRKTSFRIGNYLDVAITHKRPDPPPPPSSSSSSTRRDRPPQQTSDDNNKRRSAPNNERNGSSSAGGPIRSAPRNNDHRDRPY